MASATSGPTARTGDECDPPCPLRPGSFCALCVPGSTGPGDCGLVYLVLSDPQLRRGLDAMWTGMSSGSPGEPEMTRRSRAAELTEY
jgi:hypothetical protein